MDGNCNGRLARSEMSAHRQFAEKVPEICTKYSLSSYLGRGHSAKVIRAVLRDSEDKTEYAIKLLGSTTDLHAIRHEIRVLQHLKGCQNVLQYIEHFQKGNYTALVTNYQSTLVFKDVFRTFTPADTQHYMRNLLIALTEVHSKGYLHGDVKPANFLFSDDLSSFLLIDFGMAQKVETQLKDRGTKGFKSPETLLKFHLASFTLDVWSSGVLFAALLSGVYPFFYANGSEAFKEFCTIFGAEAVLEVGHKLGKPEYVEDWISGMEMQQPLDLRKLCYFFRLHNGITKNAQDEDVCHNCHQLVSFCLCLTPPNELEDNIADSLDDFPSSTYDLLNKMLTLDPAIRISAEEALNHDFFKETLTTVHPYCECPERKFKGIINGLSSLYQVRSYISDFDNNQSSIEPVTV